MVPFLIVNLCLNKSFRLLMTPEIMFFLRQAANGVVLLHFISSQLIVSFFLNILKSKAIFLDTNSDLFYSVVF